MTGEKFALIVNKRADQRVQKKVDQFKKEVKAALAKLTNKDYRYHEIETIEHRYFSLLQGGKNSGEKWPVKLWEREQLLVQKELLSTLDEMQKALISIDAPPGPEDVTHDGDIE